MSCGIKRRIVIPRNQSWKPRKDRKRKEHSFVIFLYFSNFCIRLLSVSHPFAIPSFSYPFSVFSLGSDSINRKGSRTNLPESFKFKLVGTNRFKELAWIRDSKRTGSFFLPWIITNSFSITLVNILWTIFKNNIFERSNFAAPSSQIELLFHSFHAKIYFLLS